MLAISTSVSHHHQHVLRAPCYRSTMMQSLCFQNLKLLRSPTRRCAHVRHVSTVNTPRRFRPTQLDHVENVELYRPGGFHPISIGDTFAHVQYRILHKLGFGGSSTVWLARDEERHRLVALKAMRADLSAVGDEPAALAICRKLQASLPPPAAIQVVEDYFRVDGPNGSHSFLVSALAGPSVRAMSDGPGRTAGSRRLRADLARAVAKQTATTLLGMHRAGVVHGDLTTANVLFQLAPHVLAWSDSDVYAHLGKPETEEVKTLDGTPSSPHAPEELVERVDDSVLAHFSYLQEATALADFGQSYDIAAKPPDYQPRTALHYCPPEMQFEGRVGFEADVWMLGCALFEMRAGVPLFEPFFGSAIDITKQMVELLGRLPEPWWSSFTHRTEWFEEDGSPKSLEEQERAGVMLQSIATSIEKRLQSIGAEDQPPDGNAGRMIERSGTRMGEQEVALLADLLKQMLRYRPEDRITMEQVVAHPWFSL